MASPLSLTSTQIIDALKSEYLVPLTQVAGRAMYTSAGVAGPYAALAAPPAAAPPAANNNWRVANTMRNDWNPGQFTTLASYLVAAAPAPAALAAPAVAGAVPPLTGANWPDYPGATYAANLAAIPAIAAGVTVADQKKAVVRMAVQSTLNIPQGSTAVVGGAAAGVAGAAALAPPAGYPVAGANNNSLRNVIAAIFAGDWSIDAKTKKAIFNVPKSDELLRRFASVLFAKKVGIDVVATVNNAVPLVPNLSNSALAMESIIRGSTYNSMPKSDSDMYIALLGLNKEDLESLARYDERVDRIREALSQGPAPGQPSGIQPGNIVPNPVLNSVSVFSAYPASLQEALRQRRKSDPSATNPAATLNRIRISMNGGAYNPKTNNLVGGNASRALPLYPRLVMNGGSHPLAVMEGGAVMAAWPGFAAGPLANAVPPTPWPTTRANPNPVSLLDSRIKELESQFSRTTGQNLGALSGQIRGYSDGLNTAMDNLQKELQNLADANKALSQFSPGLGLDVSASTSQDLKRITDQADKINKDAAKASKQLDKLTQIKDSLEELVNKSNPAPRT